jgi:hypothetical protein
MGALRTIPIRSLRSELAAEAVWSFDAAVSSSCLHNLRDFRRIPEIYGEIREQLKAGGVFEP